MSAMQPLNPKDYGREMKNVDMAKTAISHARALVSFAALHSATCDSLEFYAEIERQLQDILGDLHGHETRIEEASQPQHASFYEVAE